MMRLILMGTKDLVNCCQLSRRLLINRSVSSQKEYRGPLAQLAEQGTLNAQVAGSTPARPTNAKSVGQNYYSRPLLKYQAAKRGPPGTFLPLSCLKEYAETPRTVWPLASLYVIDDNANEACLAGSLTLRDITLPNNANETKWLSLVAPSTLPESMGEVVI